MAKQPFRSIGLRVRDFARTHIRSYVPSGETVSRSALPPSWQENTDETLVWRDDAPSAAPISAEAPAALPEPQQPAAPVYVNPSSANVTQGMLERLLEAHEARMAEQAASQPAEASAPAAAPSVQRQADNSSEGEAPRMVTRRRRGAVIDVPSPRSPSAEEDTPSDFFFLNDAAPDAAVQRAPASLPAPQTPPETPSAAAPATSFWRRLFSRGDNTPETPEPEAASDFASSAPSYETNSAQQASSAESYTPYAASTAPSVQRAAADAPAQPEIQRAPAEAIYNAPTILTPEDTAYTAVAPQTPRINTSASTASPAAPSQTNETPRATPTAGQTGTNAPAVQRSTTPNVDSSADSDSLPAFTQNPPDIAQSSSSAIQREVSADTPQPTDTPAPRAQRKSRSRAGQTAPPAASSDAAQPTVQRSVSSESTPVSASPVQNTDVSEPDLPTTTTPAPSTVQRQVQASAAPPAPSITPTPVQQPVESSGLPSTPDAPSPIQRQVETSGSQPAPTSTQRGRKGKSSAASAPADVQRQVIDQTPASSTAQPAQAGAAQGEQAVNRAEPVDQASATLPSTSTAPASSVVQRRAEPQRQNAVPSDSVSENTVSATNTPAQSIRQAESQSPPSVQRSAARPTNDESAFSSDAASTPATTTPPGISNAPTSTPGIQRAGIDNEFPINPLSEQPPSQVQRSVAPPSSVDVPDVTDAADQAASYSQPAGQTSRQPNRRPTPAVQRSANSTRQPARRIQRSTRQSSPADAASTQSTTSSSMDAAPVNASAPDVVVPAVPSPLQGTSGQPHIEHFTESQSSAPVQRQSQPAATPDTLPPAEGGMLDAPTLLTPAAPRTVQRSTQEGSSEYAETAETFTPDAPTLLTPSAQAASPSSSAPVIQRQSEPTRRSQPPVAPTPWADFMQPAETLTSDAPSAPAVQRPVNATTPPPASTNSIQRAPQPAPATPRTTSGNANAQPQPSGASSSSFNLASDEISAFPEQQDDVFTAMMNAGMRVSTSEGASAPPQISRSIVRDTAVRHPQPTSDNRVAQPAATEAESADSDLLSLLNLPTTTPIIGRTAPSTTVSRSSAPASQPAPAHHEPTSPPPPLEPPSIEAEGDEWGDIMRAQVESADSSSSGASNDEEAAENGVNVDKLARDVLDVLRRRLRVEQERRGGRP